jgi:hypothetical protein
LRGHRLGCLGGIAVVQGIAACPHSLIQLTGPNPGIG